MLGARICSNCWFKVSFRVWACVELQTSCSLDAMHFTNTVGVWMLNTTIAIIRCFSAPPGKAVRGREAGIPRISAFQNVSPDHVRLRRIVMKFLEQLCVNLGGQLIHTPYQRILCALIVCCHQHSLLSALRSGRPSFQQVVGAKRCAWRQMLRVKSISQSEGGGPPSLTLTAACHHDV